MGRGSTPGIVGRVARYMGNNGYGEAREKYVHGRIASAVKQQNTWYPLDTAATQQVLKSTRPASEHKDGTFCHKRNAVVSACNNAKCLYSYARRLGISRNVEYNASSQLKCR